MQLVCVVFLVALTFFGSIADSVARSIGKANAVEGVAGVSTFVDPRFKSLLKGDSVALTDTVRTEQLSKVWLQMANDAQISLGAQSEMHFYEFGRSGNAELFGADLTIGSARVIKKLPGANPPSRFAITTPTALITVEPGDEETDFIVQVRGALTAVTVLRGQVRLKNISDSVPLFRILSACGLSSVEHGREPSRVIPADADLIKGLLTATAIPQTLQQDMPNCATGQTKPGAAKAPEKGSDVFYPKGENIQTAPCKPCEIWNGEICTSCAKAGMTCINNHCVKVECPKCSMWDGSKCVTCEEKGRQCVDGRCVQPECKDCTAWNGQKCVKCEEMSLECKAGACVSPPCKDCQVRSGERCVSCEELGLTCIGGSCVRGDCTGCAYWDGKNCVPCEQVGRTCVEGKCVLLPCSPCQIRRGGICANCESAGMRCEGGRCVVPLVPEPAEMQTGETQSGGPRPEAVPTPLLPPPGTMPPPPGPPPIPGPPALPGTPGQSSGIQSETPTAGEPVFDTYLDPYCAAKSARFGPLHVKRNYSKQMAPPLMPRKTTPVGDTAR
jgi:hypothetical protein